MFRMFCLHMVVRSPNLMEQTTTKSTETECYSYGKCEQPTQKSPSTSRKATLYIDLSLLMKSPRRESTQYYNEMIWVKVLCQLFMPKHVTTSPVLSERAKGR